jgi:lipoate-protein ligase A
MSIDIPVLNYVLNGGSSAFCVWEPRFPIVVIGRGGSEELEVKTDNCIRDGVPVFRRKTGGGAVVLIPGVLVFSLAKKVAKDLVIREYTGQVNEQVINFLSGSGVKDLTVRGISDICIGNRKIMGSGMFRRKKILFFQGSILVDPDIKMMDRYLKPPPKPPDYRKNRDHADFITTLSQHGIEESTKDLVIKMRQFWQENLKYIY